MCCLTHVLSHQILYPSSIVLFEFERDESSTLLIKNITMMRDGKKLKGTTREMIESRNLKKEKQAKNIEQNKSLKIVSKIS